MCERHNFVCESDIAGIIGETFPSASGELLASGLARVVRLPFDRRQPSRELGVRAFSSDVIEDQWAEAMDELLGDCPVDLLPSRSWRLLAAVAEVSAVKAARRCASA